MTMKLFGFPTKNVPKGAVIKKSFPTWTDGRTAEESMAQEIVAAIVRGKNDPDVRMKAIQIIQEAGMDGREEAAVVAAIQRWVQTHIIYVHDPVGSEVFQEARYTLMETGAGDCDDQAILTGALLMSVGIKARVILLSQERDFDPKTGRFTHVFVTAITPDGLELWAETIVPNAGLNYRHFHTALLRFDVNVDGSGEPQLEVIPGGTGERAPVPGFSGIDQFAGLD